MPPSIRRAASSPPSTSAAHEPDAAPASTTNAGAPRGSPHAGTLDGLTTRPALHRTRSAPAALGHAAAPASAAASSADAAPLPTPLAHGRAPRDTNPPPLDRTTKALRQIDATALLGLGRTQNDREFVEQLRDGASEGANLPRLLHNLDVIEQRVDSAGLPDELAARLKAKLGEVRTQLRGFEHDQDALATAGKVLGANLVPAIIPFIVPMVGQPRQQQFAAELFALVTKTVLEGIGIVRAPTTSNGLILDRAWTRNYANVMQALEFLVPTFVKPSLHLSSNIGLDMGAAVVSTALLFLGFMRKETRHKFNRWIKGTPEPKLRKIGDGLAPAMRDALAGIRDMTLTENAALRDTRDTFVEGDAKALSPQTSKQVQLALSAYSAVAEDAMLTLGESAPVAADNPDRMAKIALTAFTAMVTLATAALMIPDMIGVVDLGSDAAFTISLMASFVDNPNVSAKDALEEFKTFSGLSVVLLVMLCANKAGGDFMEKGLSGLLIGSLVMSALNATLPGTVGSLSARGLEAAMRKFSQLDGSQLQSAMHGIGHTLHDTFVRHARSVVPGVARVEELPPDVELGAVAS